MDYIKRQVGFDIARAIAIAGMVIVNFKNVMSAEDNGPAWLTWFVGLFDGRASATFVILAGVGMSLLSRRARKHSDICLLSANRSTLVKRAAFLFCFGIIFASVWPADILHFYGIYLLVGTYMLTASSRQLWLLSAGLSVGFLILLSLLDYDKGWNWETLDYVDFWTFEGMVRHLFFNGFHPVIPWTAFVLVGIWLGRLDLTNPPTRCKILASAVGVVFIAEMASVGITHWMLAGFPGENPIDIRSLCDTSPIPPTPLYLLSAGGSALIVIIMCIFFAERLQSIPWLLEPFVSTGQLALTLYMAHVIFGMGFLEAIGKLENQGLIMAFFSAICFFSASMVFAMIWRRFFKLGPLEWVMRKVTG